jgi:hypothetical protein
MKVWDVAKNVRSFPRHFPDALDLGAGEGGLKQCLALFLRIQWGIAATRFLKVKRQI